MAKYCFKLLKPPNMKMDDFKKVLQHHLDRRFEQLDNYIGTDPCVLEIIIECDHFKSNPKDKELDHE